MARGKHKLPQMQMAFPSSGEAVLKASRVGPLSRFFCPIKQEKIANWEEVEVADVNVFWDAAKLNGVEIGADAGASTPSKAILLSDPGSCDTEILAVHYAWALRESHVWMTVMAPCHMTHVMLKFS
ncbi:hypothetical protein CRG98_029181 [Punica granatum]|uniref:Uncharacterized protein n=1 Tax=Punica granatum TaxID=22663 RepID=A0A2I0J2H2_PUNGR|nr:hypothetical protein CRG98_029181 [Punica granatum]